MTHLCFIIRDTIGSNVKEADISSIIIDGYNLIGTSHGDLARERERLLKIIASYRRTKGHDITVVFDGWKAGGRHEESLTLDGVKVIYSRLGDSADSVITRIVCDDRREWIVVSSDRDVGSRAWACGSVPVPGDVFLEAVERAGTVFVGEYELLSGDDEAGTVGRKGSGRTPSRKEKALRRVLRKL